MRFPIWFTLSAFFASGCEEFMEFDEDTEAVLQEMVLTDDTVLPDSPTNRYADELDAAVLGRAIFFDKRMSGDGTVACATCHVESEGWSDDRVVSEGVEASPGARHSMPSHTLAYQSFFFWDGRADSAWSQTLQAIESDAEMDFSRDDVAHYISQFRLENYENVFGEIPKDFANDPEAVNRIFANVGKSIEAYERKLVCSNTRFDRWATGDVEMTRQEETGAAVFVQGGCIDCHNGVAFSDGLFHELGVESRSNDDIGREGGIATLLDNPFNSVGAYSDDVVYGEALLLGVLGEDRTEDAYKTPSLRGVAQRGRFGHGGAHGTLRSFIQETYRNGTRAGLDPLLNGVNLNGQADAVVAFLTMLNCPPVDAAWQSPEDFEQ